MRRSPDGISAVTFRDVFAVAEFRSLWAAQVVSLAGDQLARVALSLLVWARTGSAVLTAASYALTYLPLMVGGALLGGIADHRPRRAVMVSADLARAALIAAMALPGMPLGALCALLATATLLSSPFEAARAATLPDVLTGDRYVVGSAVTNITIQAAQVLGFAVGGAVVVAIGSRSALALDAATFALSALLIRRGVAARPPAGGERPTPWLARLRAGAQVVLRDPQISRLTSLAWLNGLWIVPEGLAVPYARSLHAGPVAVGVLLAAGPAGVALGCAALARFVAPPARLRMMLPLAAVAGLPLVACLARPGLALSVLLWAASGLATSYNLPANAAFVSAVPAACRGQAFALVQAGMVLTQGLGLVGAGAAAELLAPTTVLAVTGAVGTAVVGLLALHARRTPVPTVPEQPAVIDLREPAASLEPVAG